MRATVNHFEIGAALGVSPDNTTEQNMERLRRMWSGRPEDAAHRSGVLRAIRAGHLDGDLYDPRSAWLRHREIAGDGAVLVRPDRFIAWRSLAGAREPRAALAAAFTQILARPS